MSYIEIKKADITGLETDAIVNAANSGLWAGGGVCGAIFKAAGHDQLARACEQIGHCDTGSAVITPGFDLKAKYIIHAVGPKWSGGKRDEPEQLLGAYRRSLELADQNGCESIGFPLISSGIFGYPTDLAWQQAILACREHAEEHPESILRITFAVLNDRLLEMGLKTQQELYPASIIREEDAGGAQMDYETAVRTITPGKYRHYKGNEYEVLCIARHSESTEPMVVYRALYGEQQVWVRPAYMWNENVEVDGQTKKRFEKIEA